jgi:hypothetical protein
MGIIQIWGLGDLKEMCPQLARGIQSVFRLLHSFLDHDYL